MTVRAQRHFLAEREAGGAIDDHFVMAPHKVASGREYARTPGPTQLVADEEEAERLAIELGLHRLVGNGTGALHAIDPADQFPGVAWDAR